MNSAVHRVTVALIEAELAFSFSPFEENVPHSATWFLDFEDDREEELWLEDNEEGLIFSTVAPSAALDRGEQVRRVGDVLWLSRAPTREVFALAWLSLDDLTSIRDRAYELLEFVKSAEKKAARVRAAAKTRAKRKKKAKRPG